MRRRTIQWLSLILAVMLAFSAAAAFAETETGTAQEWYDLAVSTYADGDHETAAEYLRMAADAGHGDAQNALGLLYYYGDSVEQSYEKAMEYWEMAAGRDHAAALVNLGYLYMNGSGVEQSKEKAFEYFLRGADLGDTAGMQWAGYSYEFGEGTEQSSEKALEYFSRAADLGDSTSANWMGYMYENGRGVEQSYEKAAEYYLASAEAGNPAGQASLGLLYENGNGVEQSYEKAREYYQMSADLAEQWGYTDGLTLLARLYQEGLGVEQSADKALGLYALAAQLGSDEALEEMQKLSSAGDSYGLVQTEGIVIPDYTKESVKKYDIPHTAGMDFVKNLKAGWNLGNTFDAYRQGSYVPPDYETFWSGAKTTQGLIHAIHEAGFNLIRVPVSWHDHLTDDAYTIDPAWLARVQEVVGWALEEDMYVIVNIHHDNSLEYLYPDSAHYEQSERYITAIWTQLAAAFADYDEHVIFEAMNEPRLVGTDYEWNPNPEIPEVLDAMQCINKLNRKFVETVRAAGGCNETRFLLVPGYSGSYGGAAAKAFELPEDDRVIVEVHAYTPYSYALDMSDPDSSFDLRKDSRKKSEIAGFIDDLYKKFVSNGTPVIIDEFGALRKNDGDLQDRVNFAAFYTAMASARGLPVVWWDNSNFTGDGEKFGLIDRNRLQWVYPDIALAIVTNCTVNRGE